MDKDKTQDTNTSTEELDTDDLDQATGGRPGPTKAGITYDINPPPNHGPGSGIT